MLLLCNQVRNLVLRVPLAILNAGDTRRVKRATSLVAPAINALTVLLSRHTDDDELRTARFDALLATLQAVEGDWKGVQSTTRSLLNELTSEDSKTGLFISIICLFIFVFF